MRVLVFHGYLLRGTGSNEYTAGLAAALLGLGHEVHLVCQERHASELSFVGAVGDWDTGELVVRRVGAQACTVYRPDIGDLLPVYVRDHYEGIEARLFPELSDEQLRTYLRANVDAVTEVVARARPDVALANHLVMGAAILARALQGTGVPYAIKIHGSALEYTVKPHPRFVPYAREGIRDARTVLVGSRYTAESLWATLDDPALPERTRLGPPGVDARRFRPMQREAAVARSRALAHRIAHRGTGLHLTHDGGCCARDAPQSSFARDDAATASAVADLVKGAHTDRLVAFVGKLILAKGIDLLLLAWPLVVDQVPSARLAIVGFGGYRTAAQRLVDALSVGDLDAIHELAATGRAAEGGPASRLAFVASFLGWLNASGGRERYLTVARGMRERVIFVGRLEHDELADFLPLCETVVVPSTFPESFGMVAVEAAACGVLPITAAHSGLNEVSQILATALPQRLREFVSFTVGPEAVRSIATCLIGYLCTDPDVQDAVRTELVRTITTRYSWAAVARGAIAAARGDLDALERPA